MSDNDGKKTAIPLELFEESQIPVKKVSNPHWRKEKKFIIKESDILEVILLGDKRAKIRTKKGLFCCIVNPNGTFKVIKLLKRKSECKKASTAPEIDDWKETALEQNETISSEWKEAMVTMMPKNVPQSNPMREAFLKSFLEALKSA